MATRTQQRCDVCRELKNDNEIAQATADTVICTECAQRADQSDQSAAVADSNAAELPEFDRDNRPATAGRSVEPLTPHRIVDMSEPNNPQAFPERCSDGYDLAGMALRDYFAGKALATASAYPPVTWLMRRDVLAGEDVYSRANAAKALAEWAYEVADAMLTARSS